jgi:hypothetical protein
MRGGAAAAECSGCVQLRADRDSVWRRESAARLGWNRKQDARVCGSSVGHGRGLSDKMEQPSLDGRLPSLSGRWRESAGQNKILSEGPSKKRESVACCILVWVLQFLAIFTFSASQRAVRRRESDAERWQTKCPSRRPLEFGVWTVGCSSKIGGSHQAARRRNEEHLRLRETYTQSLDGAFIPATSNPRLRPPRPAR